MDHQQKSWTLNDSARASNTGELSVERIRWLMCYPKWPLIWASSCAAFLILAIFVHWVFWIPFVLLLLMNWLYWRRVREHFQFGDANPGIVLSLDPMYIAVYTDLTMGIGEYPVVKIFEKKMNTICGQLPQVGTLVPTIALYQPSVNPEQQHWANFDPRPVDCATTDLDEVRRVMDSFTPEAIAQLKTWLQQVPKPYAPGLYPINKSL